METYLEALHRSLAACIAREPLVATLNLPAIARQYVRLATHRGSVAIGESRIGGAPDVPPGFEWPRWTPPTERKNIFARLLKPNRSVPLGFIAQIDLSAIPRVSDMLPESGWLYFFYDRSGEPWGFDPADRGSCRIVYAKGDRASLQRANPPQDAEPEHLAECCRVDASPALSLPSDLPDVEYGTPIYEAYERVRNELSMNAEKAHQLLGHPQLIQNPMELECQLASSGVNCGEPAGYESPRAKALAPGAADWRLLLQIDTDEEGPGWMWGDVGRIYFWIREQDLRALRFEDAWVILQCF